MAGGNFVSGYNWKDGIGDRDKRPPEKIPHGLELSIMMSGFMNS